MADYEVVSRTEWLQARKALPERSGRPGRWAGVRPAPSMKMDPGVARR